MKETPETGCMRNECAFKEVSYYHNRCESTGMACAVGSCYGMFFHYVTEIRIIIRGVEMLDCVQG